MSESAKKRGFIEGSGFKKGQKPWNIGKKGFLSDKIWVTNGEQNKRVSPDYQKKLEER